MSALRGTALVIAHEPAETGGQIEVRLEARGFAVDTHVVTDGTADGAEQSSFPDRTGYDLIVPMGSIRSLTEKEEIDWVHAELALIGEAHDAGVPVLGVCFGGQLIADALGGVVERAPVTELGWYEITPVADVAAPIGVGPWMQWHHDRFLPPPGAVTLATTDVAVQLFRIGRSVGTQFHPEVDVDHVGRWLAGTADEYLERHGVSREGLLRAVRDNEARNIEQCHALVDWFLDEVAFAD